MEIGEGEESASKEKLGLQASQKENHLAAINGGLGFGARRRSPEEDGNGSGLRLVRSESKKAADAYRILIGLSGSDGTSLSSLVDSVTGLHPISYRVS